MKNFTRLLESLETAPTDKDRIDALHLYWAKSENLDRLWSIYLLLSRRIGKSATPKELSDWALEQSQLPEWLFESARATATDMAETCALILGPRQSNENRPLHYWIALLLDLASKPANRRELIEAAWAEMDAPERYWFNRMLLGTFRFKLKRKILVDALAIFTKKSTHQLWHRLLADWNPGTSDWDTLWLADHPLDHLVEPYEFVSIVETDWEKAEVDLSAWRVEWQRWGIAVQLILRQGKMVVWSEAGEWLGDKLPELEALVGLFEEGQVFVGQLLAFKAGQFLPTKLLEERLAKKESKKSRETCPVLFLATDLLEWEGRDIRSQSLVERLALLEKGVEEKDLPECFALSDPLDYQDQKALADLVGQAAEFAATGFLMRLKQKPYRQNPYHWKKPPDRLTAVLLYVGRDERNPDRLNQFSFAVRSGAEELIPIAKCFYQTTEEEKQDLLDYIKQNTIERFGPVFSIKAGLIFSLSYTGLRLSKRRKAGLELTEPQVIGWQREASLDQLSTLAELQKQLQKLEQQGGV